MADTEQHYVVDPSEEYTKPEEEIIGEITSNINGQYVNGVYQAPPYEKSGDFDKEDSSDIVTDGYYYFLRPFPVEGAYVLEIYRRNDESKVAEEKVKTLGKDLEDKQKTITNYETDRKNITDKKDSKKNWNLAEWVSNFNSAVSTIINFINTAKDEDELLGYLNTVYTRNCIDEYIKYETVLNNETASQAQIEAAWNLYKSKVDEFIRKVNAFELDISSAYATYYNTILTGTDHMTPNRNEAAVTTATTNYDNFVKKYITDSLQLLTIATGSFDEDGEPAEYAASELVMSSSSTVQSLFNALKRVDSKFRTSKIEYDDCSAEYNQAKAAAGAFDPNAKDKKFLAYKILNRNPEYPDDQGLYRNVVDVGSGLFNVEIKNAKTGMTESTHIIDNSEMYPKWETPDRYFILFEKLETGTPVFTVSCGKGGTFSDTEGILTYTYRGNNSSPTLGDEFNLYDGSDGCNSIKRYRTSFKFFNSTKTYRTTTTNSKAKGSDSIRYNLFDARKPYPVTETKEVEQITRAKYKSLEKKEQIKYHKIGAPTMDVDMQKIMEAMNQVKPAVSSLMPITQVMGSLQPLIGALQSAKSMLDTVKTLLQTVQSAIDTIAGLPIVGVVAAPLKGILDIIKNLAGAIVTMYMKNYALLQRIRDIKDKLDPQKIKAQLDEITETIDAHLDAINEKQKARKKLAENGTLEDLDKKKMSVASPNKEGDMAQGSGAGLFADFNAKALIPEMPKEIMDQINQVKSTVDQLKSVVDTVDQIKTMGDQVDQAMTTISQVKGILTGTPPMEMIMENVRKQALADIHSSIKAMEAYDKKQKELAEEAKKQKDESIAYETVVTHEVEKPFEEAIDEETIKDRAKPKVEG